ncbi:MAG: hypothetical protein U0869_06915 [Chloroflexota bacterium]
MAGPLRRVPAQLFEPLRAQGELLEDARAAIVVLASCARSSEAGARSRR